MHVTFFLVAMFLAVKHHTQLPVWVQVLQQIVGFFTNSFIGPMYATGLTLFYYDQRVRKEGYDIEWMMEAAGMGRAALPVETQPAPEPSEPSPNPGAPELGAPEPVLSPPKASPEPVEGDLDSETWESNPIAEDPAPPETPHG